MKLNRTKHPEPRTVLIGLNLTNADLAQLNQLFGALNATGAQTRNVRQLTRSNVAYRCFQPGSITSWKANLFLALRRRTSGPIDLNEMPNLLGFTFRKRTAQSSQNSNPLLTESLALALRLVGKNTTHFNSQSNLSLLPLLPNRTCVNAEKQASN